MQFNTTVPGWLRWCDLSAFGHLLETAANAELWLVLISAAMAWWRLGKDFRYHQTKIITKLLKLENMILLLPVPQRIWVRKRGYRKP